MNIGPVQPPQRKGRVPYYSRNQFVELQAQFDELEQAQVFRRPENLDITVEYLNPSFFVKKPPGGHRLVTAFADVARYSKPQPSVMPDVDTTLRTIAPWRYMIKTDLTRAFYQIPLSKSSLKYCGVATPFRGVRVYTRSAMGMPGSETALEEMMCRVLGDFIEEGFVAKLADDLYCGGDSPEALLNNWRRVLQALDRCNLRLSPTKTVICPKTTSVLGWIWSQGRLLANPHRIAVLASCPPPSTVKGLRSFIGAYKVLSRVLPNCSNVIAPLECALTGLQSSDRLLWDENLTFRFKSAQDFLSNHKAIVLPRPSDTLWIVTDGSVTRRGLGATLYVSRTNQLHLAGFFSAKLRKHQVTWLPCEVEALSIAASVKHFSPFIIQSPHPTTVLTDSKPCVQAIDKLCRGEFSASPRVNSFLTTVSRYQVNLQHLAGKADLPSDFTSQPFPFPGLSSRALWTQRNQFTHEQLPLSDYDLILGKHEQRSTNHAPSEKSKNPRGLVPNTPSLQVGDIVYLISDKDKSRARDRYIVVSIDFPWCFVKKFSGSQLRATSYKVKLSECYATSPSVIVADHSGPPASQDQDDEPSPVTPAVPAASVLPESPPPAPPELTSVPSDEEQFPSSTCDDTTLEAPIGVPSLPVLQEEPSTSATAPDQALPSCPSSSPETPGPRPQRQRKPPSYLNDYVRF